jgi:hypothetical protein
MDELETNEEEILEELAIDGESEGDIDDDYVKNVERDLENIEAALAMMETTGPLLQSKLEDLLQEMRALRESAQDEDSSTTLISNDAPETCEPEQPQD